MFNEVCLQKCLFATNWFSNFFPANTTQLFPQSLSSHTLCSCLEILLTNNNLCNFWHSKFQQVSTYAFCSFDDIITQKWNCSSPNNLFKCTESPSMLSTNTSLEWNLYSSWSNLEVAITSFRLEMNVGGFSKHHNKTSDTDRYKWYFFTARVSQVNVNTMEKNFEQRSELQFAKYLIVHVLSSSYNISSLELRNKRKAMQQWSLRIANKIMLDQVCVYHERVYVDNVVSKFWFVRPFPSFSTLLQLHYRYQFWNVSQIRTKECKTRYFICKINFNFLRSSRHSNCDTNFAVIVSFLNESVHGFNSIFNGRVKTRFRIVDIWELWKFLIKKHKFSLRDILVKWWVGFFRHCNLPLTFQIQLLR